MVEKSPNTPRHALGAQVQRIDFLDIIGPRVGENLDEAAGGEVVHDVEATEPREAAPGDGHPPHGLAIVGQQASLDHAIRDAPVLTKWPCRGRPPKVESEAIMMVEVVDRLRRSVALQIIRRRHDVAGGRPDPNRYEIGIGQDSYAERDFR